MKKEKVLPIQKINRILVLGKFKDYTVQEISKETNVPKSHVSTILKYNLYIIFFFFNNPLYIIKFIYYYNIYLNILLYLLIYSIFL